MKELSKMGKLFTSLNVGDLVSTPSSKHLVLRNYGDMKLFGQLCSCGDHINGDEDAYSWSSRKNAPITPDGSEVAWWDMGTVIEIEREHNVKLAQKFSHLACNADFPIPGNFNLTQEERTLVTKMLEVNFCSDVDRRIVELQRLKLLGIELDERQLKIMTAVLGSEISGANERLSVIGALGEMLAVARANAHK